MNKKELRILYKRIRKEFTANYRAASEDVIIEKLINFFNDKTASQISSFSPIGDEIDVTKFNEYVLNSHHTLLLPKMVEQEMFFINPKEVNLAYQMPDYCIMPCICYDSYRYRIGYGKGFYDRFLQGKDNIFKILPNYAALKTDIKIPYSRWDVAANLIINEEEEF